MKIMGSIICLVMWGNFVSIKMILGFVFWDNVIVIRFCGFVGFMIWIVWDVVIMFNFMVGLILEDFDSLWILFLIVLDYIKLLKFGGLVNSCFVVLCNNGDDLFVVKMDFVLVME